MSTGTSTLAASSLTRLAASSWGSAELDRSGADAAAAPAGTEVEQLGPGEAEDQQRRLAHPGGEVLDQLEQRFLGPVNVLEEQDERLLLRDPLCPFARCPGDLLRARLRLDRLEHARGQPEQVGHGLVLAERAQLLDRDVERVVVRDPGRALDHLGERPVGDALAVGKAPAGEHGRALERVRELARQTALADPGLAVDREQVRAAVAQGALVGVLQQIQLGVAADERRLHRARAPAAAAVRAKRAPGPHRLGDALQLDRAEILHLDPPQRQPVRPGAEDELPGLRGLLEPGRQVDRLAGGEGRLAVLRDDLSGLDADTRLELQLPDRIEDGQARANGALRVVLVGLRDPERGHHRVACELLDDPAVRHHAVRDAVEEGLDTATHDLRIRTRHERGRVDEVHEENRCQLAFHPYKCKNDRAPAMLPSNRRDPAPESSPLLRI